MLIRRLKQYLRRRRLVRSGVTPEVRVPTWTAGARSGVWTLCPDYLPEGGIVYSFGVGDNIAWELALLERFNLTVHAFDPTPASIAWVRAQELPGNFHFHPVGLADHDGVSHFVLGPRGSRFNYRPVAEKGAEGIEAPVARLDTLRTRLGHDRIDVLKVDIEGGEFDVLPHVLACLPAPRQILVEVHHHFPGMGLGRTLDLVGALRQAGFRLFHVSERGLELAFLRP